MNKQEKERTETDYISIFERQNEIFQMMALGYDETVILDRLCLFQESFSEDVIAAVLLYNDEKEMLSVHAIPSLADSNTYLFDQQFHTIDNFAGTLELALCLSLPIRKENDEIIGFFVLLSAHEIQLNTFQKTLLQNAATTVGILLNHLTLENALEKSQQRSSLMETMFDNLREGIIITNEDFAIIEVNAAFEKISGYREMEIIGYSPRMFASKQQKTAFFDHLWREVKSSGQWRGEIRNRRKSGEDYPQWMSISDIKDEEGRTTNYLCVFSDISDIRDTQAKLVYMAYHDPLTGLANRTKLFDMLDYIFKRSERAQQSGALLFLDLNRFKNLNDTFGHAIGDIVLIHVANRLREVIRKNDTIVRLGGDEFVILLEDTNDHESVLTIAQKILDSLTAPFEFHKHRFSISGSIGIARYPQDGNDSIMLLKYADTAMYQAKLERGHICFYESFMSDKLQKSLTFETDMHSAVANGEFEVFYQPKFDATTLAVTGAEALVRWNHPYRGRIFPNDFIGMAEEIDMISELDNWIVQKALEDLRIWNSMGDRRLDLSINISGRDVNTQGIEQLVSIIEGSLDLKPQLVFEMTETFLVQSVDEAVRLLERLKKTGVRLAMDDFGTGYSSLTYLKRFKMDSIKIDYSLTQDIVDNPEDREIVRAITNLGKNLGLDVIAEGIEDKEQLRIIQESGCDEVQGFYFDRALDFETFTKKYIKGRDV